MAFGVLAVETERARLFCTKCLSFTQHTFDGSERKSPHSSLTLHLFKCGDCGAQRVWGCS